MFGAMIDVRIMSAICFVSLQVDPSNRPTAAEALRHPWLTEVLYSTAPQVVNELVS